jgi:hypothetical protein
MIAMMIAAVVVQSTGHAPLLPEPPQQGQLETSPPIIRQPPGAVPALMPVFGVSTNERGVTVDLPPFGCNPVKSDFTVAVSKSADRPTVLFTRRNRANSLVLCKSQPREIAITWTYDDLGLKPGQQFSLANPLVMAP